MALSPTSRQQLEQQQQQRQSILTRSDEALGWVSYLARRLNVPMAQILGMSQAAVERELAHLISESAIAEAERRCKEREGMPDPTNTYQQAVARVMAGHEAARRIAVKARQDAVLAEMKANR